MKQTAVEWLEKEFVKLESTIGVHGVMYELMEQAKEMEKEQIKKAFLKNDNSISITDALENFEQYYNQKYKQD